MARWGSGSFRYVPAAMDAICVFSTSSFDRRSPKLKLDSNIILHFVWHQPQTIAFQCQVCQTFDCIALQEISILGTFEEIYTIPSKDKAFVDGFVGANVSVGEPPNLHIPVIYAINTHKNKKLVQLHTEGRKHWYVVGVYVSIILISITKILLKIKQG